MQRGQYSGQELAESSELLYKYLCLQVTKQDHGDNIRNVKGSTVWPPKCGYYEIFFRELK
jgi:hypothetical protein